MSLEPELAELMTARATVYAWAGDSLYGAPTYSANPTTHPCRIVGKARLVRGPDGRDVMSQSTVYLGPSSTGGMPGLTARARLVLSDGSSAQILAVGKYTDDDGSPYYEVAYCG